MRAKKKMPTGEIVEVEIAEILFKNGKVFYGYIDRSGNMVHVSVPYSHAESLANQAAAESIPFRIKYRRY